MAFIDEIKVHLKAGAGGAGVVRWRHEKGKEFAGAAGGNGGRGGDVYARAVRDLGILARYRAEKEFSAGRGGDGMRNSMHGKNGEDLYLDVPIGSIITNLETRRSYNLLNEGDSVLLLKGGAGGLGNEYFKASTNVRPKQSTGGYAGDEADFMIELELVADIGLIGLPNAGKTSLLNALTNAGAKVGSYAFTTLEPNLGDFHGFIFADIPGLIEGASEGKGLGHKFLRHVRRTKMLLHCISLENEDPKAAYETIREELKKFDKSLLDKKEIILLTKTDLILPEELEERKKSLSEFGKEILDVTVMEKDSVNRLGSALVRNLQ